MESRSEKRELSIYIHIPFCVKKCNYCDFLSFAASDSQQERYVNMLQKQIISQGQVMSQYKIRSIFIGGGTPSILKADQVDRIMEAVNKACQYRDSFQQNEPEVTIEANPGTLTKEKLRVYKELGINRLSMGLQSASDQELQILGRIHNYKTFRENYDMARELGFQNINVDLMSALPSQTMSSYQNTIEEVVRLNPEHISAYSLIIEEGTEFYKKYAIHGESKELPSEEEERDMYKMTKKMLESAGYKQYEISNYAKKGHESRHNLSYWTGIEYLGFGLGASSLLNHVRYYNERNAEIYMEKIEKNQKVMHIEENLSEADEMAEFMILGLRLTNGVNGDEFTKRFQLGIFEKYGTIIKKYQLLDLIKVRGNRIYLTENGISVSNQILIEFLPEND
ncbi:radical SAM family heme chaperone HemW [Anaeromicropila populeti]|uniref:Heme chaperone HemW n=1 Tax=Anaeromicropila populeti TaxID=37658 RepID=A0A1I6IPY1_9FIRM|nr:radical SAM family heme chaperone HemW [Anaeromicropila populeti]SFR68711.1 oxygen-independent coproporphyrinogen-3 oxidase [Anaeromicropila populeti]